MPFADRAPLQELRREVEALAGTLALMPVQRKPWPLLKAIDFMWRAPATIFFVVFLGEAVYLAYFLCLLRPHLFPVVVGIRAGDIRRWGSRVFFSFGDGGGRDPFVLLRIDVEI